MSAEQKRIAMAKVRIVESILRRWDPIRVLPDEEDGPRDEYDSYAPHIVSLVATGTTVEELAAHLSKLSAETMGVGENSERDRKFAAEIVAELSQPIV